MKRTKRYGGFLVGDKVRYKKCGFIDIEGEVVGFCNGNIIMAFRGDLNNRLSFAPNQLINLTRQEEKMKAKRIDWDIEEAFKKIFGKSSVEAIRDTLDLQAKWLMSKFNSDVKIGTYDWNNIMDVFTYDDLLKQEAEELSKADVFNGKPTDSDFNPEDYPNPLDFLMSGELLKGTIGEREQKLKKYQEYRINKMKDWEECCEQRFKRMGMKNWKPEDHDVMLGVSKVIRFSSSDLTQNVEKL